jgi:uncharacterized protein (DUF1697 family)
MPEYAAFLRGINVGRHHRVSSAELRSWFEEMGFQNVQTFRTSGNVVFAAGRESPAKLTARIEAALAEPLGYEVTVFLRTESDVRAIADHEPFPGELVEGSDGKLQVVLLPAKPSTGARKDVLSLATDEDRLAFGDRELHWLPSAGIRDSAIGTQVDKLLGPTTMRTKGTIELMAAKYFAP